MKTGKRPLPTHLKLLRGNPGQRPLNPWREPAPALPSVPPAPPEFLTGYARDEWLRIITEVFNLGLVTSVDLLPLASYCVSYQRWRTALEKIDLMALRDPNLAGLIVKTQSGGAAANPLVLIADRAARDMVRYASEFGLTPASRSRIALGEGVSGPASKFGGLLAS